METNLWCCVRSWALSGSLLVVVVYAYLPPQTSPYSLVTTFPVTIVSPLGASPHPPGPNARFNILRYLISGRYTIPSGLISMSSYSNLCCKMSDCSGVKGVAERPWKERVQSTCRSSSLRTGGGSERPSVRERSGCESEVGDKSCWTWVAFWEASWGDGAGACWRREGMVEMARR